MVRLPTKNNMVNGKRKNDIKIKIKETSKLGYHKRVLASTSCPASLSKNCLYDTITRVPVLVYAKENNASYLDISTFVLTDIPATQLRHDLRDEYQTLS